MPFAKRKQNLNVAGEIKLLNNFKYSSFCSDIGIRLTVSYLYLAINVMMMWIWALLCCVLCMNCSFEESWRESMLMMILQLCCPAISPWMTLMTWMTLTMMIMMMRVFTWKVCQWGRMTSTGGWQRWHGSLTPVTRKFPDTEIHSSRWLLFPDIGISQLYRNIFRKVNVTQTLRVDMFLVWKRPVRAENTRIMIFSRLRTQTGNWIVNYRRKHVRMLIRMRSPCLSKSNTLIFRNIHSLTNCR